LQGIAHLHKTDLQNFIQSVLRGSIEYNEKKMPIQKTESYIKLYLPKLQEKKLLLKDTCRREDIIQMDAGDSDLSAIYCILLHQDRMK
jgi:hypothetical protein